MVYKLALKHARLERVARDGIPATVKHGSRATYNNYRCRCGPCIEAMRAWQRGRYKPVGKTDLERFMAQVEKTDTCWLWRGAIKKKSGYGSFGAAKRVWPAHRWGYLNLVGPIPDGYEIDHLCFVVNCVNPAHLEAVTPLVNKQRARRTKKWHCSTCGNPYSHIYQRKNGKGLAKFCLPCRARKGT